MKLLIPCCVFLTACGTLPTDHYVRLSEIRAAGGATVYVAGNVGVEGGGCQVAWSDVPEGMDVKLAAGECSVKIERLEDDDDEETF